MKQHRCLSDQLLSTRCMILQLYACIIVSEMNSIGPGSTDNRWSPRARLWKGPSDRPYPCTYVGVPSACWAWVDRDRWVPRMKQHRCLSDQLLSTRCMILQLYACIIVSEMNSIGPGSTDNRWSPRARLWKGPSDRPYPCTHVSVPSACRAWVDRGSMVPRMRQHRCLSDQLLPTKHMILTLYARSNVSEMNSVGPGSTDN
jgi:hypothetical protein